MEIRRLETDPDLAQVMGLIERLESATGVPPLGESKFVDLSGPRRGRGLIGSDGEVVAYLHLLWHEASRVWEMELVADPDVPDAAVRQLLAAASVEAGDRMLWWTFGETGGVAFALENLPEARRLHKLGGPLPPVQQPPANPPALIRAFRPGVDEDAWLEANNGAFAGHAENGGWTRSDIIERQSREWFNAEDFRLAWVDGRVAGFCWTKRHGPELGEIYVVGVHPDFQGQGLGRRIVIEALWYLADVGCTRGMLYVDTANQTALGLYQSLGFTADRVDHCFEVPKGWPHEEQ
ncbi:MAG: mycothiol synthase [Acidimicrobiia bacterium]